MSRVRRFAVVAVISAFFVGSLSLPAQASFPVITDTKPYAGTYSMETCGFSSCLEQVAQGVSIPSNVTDGTLTWWYWGDGNDPSVGECQDAAEVFLLSNEKGDSLESFVCQEAANETWTQKTEDVGTFLVDHAGEGLTVGAFGATNEDQETITWYIDDVTLDIETSTSAAALASTQKICDPGFELGSPNECWIEQSGNQSTAKNLTITRTGNGKGTVLIGTSGTKCPPSCQLVTAPGSTRTVKAKAKPGSIFKGWDGSRVGEASDTCELTFDTDKTVFAEFGKVPAHSREVSFKLEQHLIAKGKVTSGFDACFQKILVEIQKLKNGKWDKVKSDKTTNGGRFAILLNDQPGKYRAMTPKFLPNAQHSCKAATSDPKTHKH